MTCNGKNDQCGLTSEDYAINWEPYTNFYGSSTRSNICRGCGARKCRDTDMIKEAITIIQEHPRSPSQQPAPNTKITGGKTRRRHKHKKKKTRKSHTRKRLTRGKRKNAHKKAKKTKKSK